MLLKYTKSAVLGVAVTTAIALAACTQSNAQDANTAPSAAQQMPVIVSNKTAQFGSKAKYTSEIPISSYNFGDVYLGQYINAPLQAVQAMHFKQSPDEIFDKVTSGNADWSMQIERLSWDHSKAEIPGQLSMGSVRQCDFVGGNGTAYERVYAVEPGKLFAYDLDPERSTAPLPIKDFFVIWTVEDKGSDGSLVVARIYFHEKGEMGGKAAMGVGQALAADFRNFANLYGGTYIEM